MRWNALIPLAAVCLTLSMNAQAEQAYHPAAQEAGATFVPEHIGQNSRAQVQAQLGAAMARPDWQAISRGAPWPAERGAGALTRAQVRAELDAAMAHPAWSAVSQGAPWPASPLVPLSAAVRAAR